jgi:hypothetical protein
MAIATAMLVVVVVAIPNGAPPQAASGYNQRFEADRRWPE